MSLSHQELAGIVSALQPWRGSRIQGVFCPSPSRLVLELYKPGQTLLLLLVARGPDTRVHPVERRPQNPLNPINFQMLCRKELGGTLTGLHLSPDDRVLRIEVEKNEGRRTLVAELTGRHGNILLLDEHLQILGTALPNVSQRRPLAPGQRWDPPGLTPDSPTRHRWPDLAGEELLSAVTDFFNAREEVAQKEQLRGNLLRRVRAHLRHDRRLVEKLQQDLARAEAATSLRRVADLIQIYLRDMVRGVSELEVLDIFEDPPIKRVLTVDPALSPLENMRALYHKCGRMEAATDVILKRAADAEARVETWTRLEARVVQAVSIDDLMSLSGVVGEGQTSAPRPGRRTREGRLPYHSFVNPDGCEIRVGRSARDNDTLTTSSRGNDYWLHVVGGTGAHVVVPSGGGPPSLETLLDASTLALKYSGLSEGDSAEVAYTRVKFVRKVPGIPGKVTYSQEKTLHVTLTTERLEHLLKRGTDINSQTRESTATPLPGSSHSARLR